MPEASQIVGTLSTPPVFERKRIGGEIGKDARHLIANRFEANRQLIVRLEVGASAIGNGKKHTVKGGTWRHRLSQPCSVGPDHDRIVIDGKGQRGSGDVNFRTNARVLTVRFDPECVGTVGAILPSAQKRLHRVGVWQIECVRTMGRREMEK